MKIVWIVILMVSFITIGIQESFGASNFVPPYDIVTDTEDNVYVLEGNGQIQKFDKNGNFLFKLEKLDNPYTMEIDSENYLYVYEAGTNSIQKISSTGHYVSQINGDDGVLDFPADIAIDKNNDVYVTDLRHDRVQKFDKDGNFLRKWDGRGTFAGKIISPHGIMVDSDGNIYVSDKDSHLMRKFDPNGNFLERWQKPPSPLAGEPGFVNLSTDSYEGLDGDSNGNLYAADILNNRVLKFDPAGRLLCELHGGFDFVTDVVVDSEDNLFVSDRGNSRIVHYSAECEFVSEWSTYVSGKRNAYPSAIAIDSQGILYVASSHDIRKFTKSGEFLQTIGDEAAFRHVPGLVLYDDPFKGMLLGQPLSTLSYVSALAFDDDDNLYVSEAPKDRIQKFDKSGKFLSRWSTDSLSDGQFTSIWHMDVDENGNILFMTESTDSIQMLDPNGHFLKRLDLPFYYTNILRIEPGSDGKLYLGYESGIDEIDSNGNLISLWKNAEEQDGRVVKFFDIEKDPNGGIVVAAIEYKVTYDIEHGTRSTRIIEMSIQKFSDTGQPVSKWNNESIERWSSIAIDSGSNVYLASPESGEIQKFDKDGNFIYQLVPNASVVSYDESDGIPTPLQQERDGVQLNKIACSNGRVLMTSSSGLPACVFEESAKTLEQRGFVLVSKVS